MRLILTLFVCTSFCFLFTISELSAQPNDPKDQQQSTSSSEVSTLKPSIVARNKTLSYPYLAYKDLVQGKVRLRLLVDVEGRLENVVVLKSEPNGYGFAEAAKLYVSGFEFVPPQVNDISLRSSVEINVKFTADMLIQKLREQGQYDRAERFQKRLARAKNKSYNQAGRSMYGADDDSTDVIGLSIHHLVDGPEGEILKAREKDFPPVEGLVTKLEGLILEQGTRRRIANAIVKFNGFDVLKNTDIEGRFQFSGVPVGRLIVLVERPGYASHSHEIVVEQSSSKVLRKIFLKPLSFTEREALGQHIPPRVSTKHHLQRDEIQALAGVDGDALKAARDLPGLYRAPFDLNGPATSRTLGARQWGGSGELVFRGGIEGSAYLLKTPMLTVSHLNHSRSLLPSAMLSELSVESDYELEVGRVGGGLLNLKLDQSKQGDRQIEAELNAFELSGLVGGPISSKTSITAALKLGTMRFFQNQAKADEWLRYGVQVPHSQDLNLLLNHQDGANKFTVLSTVHSSAWHEDFESPDLIQSQLRGNIGETQNGMSLRAEWLHERPEQQWQNSLNISYELLNTQHMIADQHSLDQSLTQIFIADRFKLRLDSPLWLTAGIDQQMTYSYLAQEGASLWVEGMGRSVHRHEPQELRDDSTFLYSPSAWLGLEGRWTRIHFVLGSRLTYWSETEELLPEPRVSLRYTPAFGTILKVGSGLYTQQIRPRYFDYYVGAGSQQGQTLQQAGIFSSSAGVEQRFTRELYMDLTGFYRQLNRLLVADTDPTVRFKSTGEGEAYGAEFLLRYDPDHRFYAWLSYSFTRARFKDQLDDPLRRSDFDQTHNLSAVAGFKLTPTLSLNTRWRYVSGAPYSALPNQSFDSDLAQTSFDYSEVNLLRYSAFHQLDLRLDYRWLFKDWSLLSYLQVNNAYNHQSSESPHPLEGLNTNAPSTLRTWPFWASIGLRANF